jgi:hypothetical protein
MFTKFISTAAVVAALAVQTALASLPTISQVGSKFFTSDGNQFYIKGKLERHCLLTLARSNELFLGVAYQLTDSDPLIDTAQCTLDASLMQTLGANTIRVYHVDASGSHSGCMSAFENAGIYVFVDLDTFNTMINQVRIL